PAGRDVVPGEPDGAAPARDEHALRGAQREGRVDADSEQRRRIDGDGRAAGRRGAQAGETDVYGRRREEGGVIARAGRSARSGRSVGRVGRVGSTTRAPTSSA